MSGLNLQEIHDFAIDLAKKAGKMILEGSNKRLSSNTTSTSEKKNSVDLVTETDQAVEEMVKEAIKTTYPEHKFIGEETYSAGQESILDDHPTWIVDPIDGTTNFVHGVPYVSISIGFTVSRRPTIGVVLNPFTAQLYTAIDSKGAYLTNLSTDLSKSISKSQLPLYPSQQLDLPSSVMIIEYGSDRQGNNFDVKMSTFINLASQRRGMVHGLRAYGSAALNLCSVASGYIDAYWEGGCWEWDVCAGWVVLKEAGGFIVHGNPRDTKDVDVVLEEPDLCGRVYLAVRKGQSKEETAQWVTDFWGMIGGRLEYNR